MTKSNIESVYVWLKPSKHHLANVYRDNRYFKSHRLTPASYFRLERICKAYREIEGKLSMRNREGATHYSLIISRLKPPMASNNDIYHLPNGA